MARLIVDAEATHLVFEELGGSGKGGNPAIAVSVSYDDGRPATGVSFDVCVLSGAINQSEFVDMPVVLKAPQQKDGLYVLGLDSNELKPARYIFCVVATEGKNNGQTLTRYVVAP